MKFESDLLISTVTYPLAKIDSRQLDYANGENEEINDRINLY